jgi:hypothetical protein
MDEWISVTLLLGNASSFAIDCIAALESLNIAAFSKDPILPDSCSYFYLSIKMSGMLT